MNTDILDKKIIIIDSSKCHFNNSSFDFYLDLITPIKDVLFFKTISSSITLKDFNGKINNVDINDFDNVYVWINDYNRLISNNNNVNDNIFEYFDYITIDKSKYYGSSTSTNVNFTTDNMNSVSDINDLSIFTLNPVVSSLKRINIKLYDNYNNIISSKTENVSRVIIKIAVFTTRKKISIF
jgi:hypothetical protein